MRNYWLPDGNRLAQVGKDREKMSPYTKKSVLHFIVYQFVFLLLSGVFPAGGDDSSRVPKGEVGPEPSNTTQVFERIDEEIKKAEAGIKAELSNPSSHVRLGYLLIKKGALDEALKSFDEAIRLNPRSYDAKTGKGIVLARKGNHKEAEQVLKDALILNPNPVRTHYELGLLYQKLGEFGKAIVEFKEGIKKHEQGRI
jgi:tetratricopeptide (TPR) repeat protein